MKFIVQLSIEDKGLLVSLGIIIAGNIIKRRNKDVGDMTQGFGIGVAVGTIGHLSPFGEDELLPHHDAVALASIPLTFTLDKTNAISNKTIINNLYGIGLGVLTQHLVTEGCSFCNTLYCEPGEKLC